MRTLVVAEIEALRTAPLQGPVSALSARTDPEAVAAWLRARARGSTNTFEAYRREALRLLVWLHDNSTMFRDLTLEGVERYFEHLRVPPPHWIRPVKVSRGTQLAPTQLLLGPLSDRSLAYTRTVLAQLFGFLQDAGYVSVNPFRLISIPRPSHQQGITHFLDPPTWQWLWRWIVERAAESPKETRPLRERDRFMFATLYHAGARASEVACARMGDFKRDDGRWFLTVFGKGSKERDIAVNSVLLAELRRYRLLRGMTATPSPGERIFLIPSLRSRAGGGLTRRAIGLRVAEVSNAAAAACSDEHMQQRLSAMSTHWMRHTNGTHAIEAGVSLESLQDNLGHASPVTTRKYVHVSGKARHDAAEKLAEFHRNHDEDLTK